MLFSNINLPSYKSLILIHASMDSSKLQFILHKYSVYSHFSFHLNSFSLLFVSAKSGHASKTMFQTYLCSLLLVWPHHMVISLNAYPVQNGFSVTCQRSNISSVQQPCEFHGEEIILTSPQRKSPPKAIFLGVPKGLEIWYRYFLWMEFCAEVEGSLKTS